MADKETLYLKVDGKTKLLLQEIAGKHGHKTKGKDIVKITTVAKTLLDDISNLEGFSEAYRRFVRQRKKDKRHGIPPEDEDGSN